MHGLHWWALNLSIVVISAVVAYAVVIVLVIEAWGGRRR